MPAARRSAIARGLSATDPKPLPVSDSEIEPSPAPIRSGWSVRAHLVALSAGLVLPVLAFAGFLLWQIASTERTRLEEEASDIARSVALAVDREFTGLLASLDVLSTSAYLKADDLAGFAEQASELARRQNIVPVLSDVSGQQLVNARLPFGSALPKTNLPWDERAIAAGRPYITDLFTGQISAAPIFAVTTSILRDGRPRYVLNFSLSPERLQRVIADADIAPAYTVAIVDKAGLIMARSVLADQFVGKPASADLRENTKGLQGSWSGMTVDGTTVFGAYSRSRLSDFRAAVGIRYEDLNRPLWRSLSLFLAVGLLLGALSVLLAWYLGRRIARPIAALAGHSAAVGRGEVVAPLASSLAEANLVSGELAAASAIRQERERDLSEANEEIQRFAYIVSHDLRSPLVNIMGFTSELEALRQDIFDRLASLRPPEDRAKDDDLGRDVDEALGFIKASIGKMDRLINAILRLSREGRREFKPERVDMDSLAAGIKASITHQADAAGATIEIGKLPAVQSDRLALEQIFSNLVDNALKYLRRDVPGHVEFTGRATAGGVVYAVRDNGRGIDERDKERVFDLFRRSGVQDRPGEGIGLAHVRALVRRLGGTITLTSELGRGSTFTVTLPRRWVGGGQGRRDDDVRDDHHGGGRRRSRPPDREEHPPRRRDERGPALRGWDERARIPARPRQVRQCQRRTGHAHPARPQPPGHDRRRHPEGRQGERTPEADPRGRAHDHRRPARDPALLRPRLQRLHHQARQLRGLRQRDPAARALLLRDPGPGRGMSEASLRVLYIDDDPGLARLVQKSLERRGYVVDVAHDGPSGIAKLAVAAVDVVALDQYMRQKKEAALMRMLVEMDIPVDSEGNVRYGDCVFAICRHQHGLDLESSVQACRFLRLTKERDPTLLMDSFKVHHALAVRKIIRLLKRKRENRVKRAAAAAAAGGSPSHGASISSNDLTARLGDQTNDPVAAPDASHSPLVRNLAPGTIGQ